MRVYVNSMLLIVCGVLAMHVFISCNRYKLKDAALQVYNQNITLVPDMQCFGGESIDILDLEEERPKIIIWFDSTECGLCKIHSLPEFNPLEKYCQDLHSGSDLVFLFSPSRDAVGKVLEEASKSTKLHDYPIFIDTANQFYKLNPHIPANKLMHSFLLDSEGKVVLVGNPIQNQAMFDLYKKTIEEMIN